MGITRDIIEAEFRTKGGSQVQKDMVARLKLAQFEPEALLQTRLKAWHKSKRISHQKEEKCKITSILSKLSKIKRFRIGCRELALTVQDEMDIILDRWLYKHDK